MSNNTSARSAARSAPARARPTPAAPKQRGYIRSRDLPRLVNMWPSEIAAVQERDLSLIVLRLMRALRAERRRGQLGAWSYDLSRHALLLAAYRSERRELLHRVLLDRGREAPSESQRPAAHALARAEAAPGQHLE